MFYSPTSGDVQLLYAADMSTNNQEAGLPYHHCNVRPAHSDGAKCVQAFVCALASYTSGVASDNRTLHLQAPDCSPCAEESESYSFNTCLKAQTGLVTLVLTTASQSKVRETSLHTEGSLQSRSGHSRSTCAIYVTQDEADTHVLQMMHTKACCALSVAHSCLERKRSTDGGQTLRGTVCVQPGSVLACS